MPISQEVELKKQVKAERKVYKLEDDEKEQLKIWVQRMDDGWRWMNQRVKEFDNLSLIERVASGRLVRNSYLTPIMNDGEVRVVTGTTEGKVDSIFNAVFNQNLEAEIETYNEYDIQDVLLGDALTKLVKRTEQMENSDDIEASLLDELLTQPAVFIQDTIESEWYYDRVLTQGEWDDLWQFKAVKFSDEIWCRKREPKKVLWTADQVILADFRIPARLFHTQPYYITYRTLSDEEVRAKYQHSPRYQYLNGGMPVKPEMRDNIASSDWRFSKTLATNQHEEIVCKSVQEDVMQIYVDGVPMLPVGCPYLGNRFQKPDMVMEIPKEIHRHFAYGRSVVQMVQVLQALKDEDFRLRVLQARQQIFQPIVTRAQKILSKDMWLPAAITYGVSKDDIDSLVTKQLGIDSKLQEMIEHEIEAFINVSSLFQGVDVPNMTAYQAAQQMKQALIMLGFALVARMRMKRDCTYLRLYNILQNLLDPIDTRYNDYTKESEPVYRTYSLRDADLFDGTVGTEIISFIDRKLLPQEQDKILELSQQSRKEGRPTSYTFLPVSRLKKASMMFYVNIISTEKRNSLIEKEMFKKDITDSIALGSSIGVPVNPGYVTQEWGKRVKIDAQKLYNLPPVPPVGGTMPIPQQGQGGMTPPSPAPAMPSGRPVAGAGAMPTMQM